MKEISEVRDGTIQLGKGNSEKSCLLINKVTVEIDGKQSVWWKVCQIVPDGRNWQFTRKKFIAYAPTRDNAFLQAKQIEAELKMIKCQEDPDKAKRLAEKAEEKKKKNDHMTKIIGKENHISHMISVENKKQNEIQTWRKKNKMRLFWR